MTVGELIAELEQAPRGATVRALVVGHDLVAGVADVERVHFTGTKSLAERIGRDVVIVASIERATTKQPITSRWSPIMSWHV